MRMGRLVEGRAGFIPGVGNSVSTEENGARDIPGLLSFEIKLILSVLENDQLEERC